MFHPKGPTFLELARQALSSTEQGYDLLAPKFDFTPFRTPGFALSAARQIINREAVRSDGRIGRALDICCGTGAGMEMLRPLCEKVVGLDMSQGMLEVAEKNSAAWAGSAHLEFVRGDALNPPELGGLFDVAVCFGAQGHILPKQESQFLSAIRDQLKDGGRFFFITSASPPWWSLRSLLSRGFNAAMHVRNLMLRPPFNMFYLTFLLPEIEEKLRDAGYDIIVHEGDFPGPLKDYRVVEAVKV